MTFSFEAILPSSARSVGALLAVTIGGLLAACSNLADVTSLPNDKEDVHAGFHEPGPMVEDGGPGPRPMNDGGARDGRSPEDAAISPAHVRVAHLLQGGPALDLCLKLDDPAAPWEAAKISTNPAGAAPNGLAYGEVSTRVAVDVPAAGAKYLFSLVALGAPCAGAEAGAALLSFSGTLAPEAGLTLIAFGVTGETGETAPKGIAYPDLAASASAGVASIRAFHGVPDLPPFDLMIGSATPATGIKYGTAVGFPYTSRSGYGSVAGGAPAGATLTLKAGTLAPQYKLPEMTKGTVATVFTSGLATTNGMPPMTVLLCVDNASAATATCTKLAKM